MVDYWCESRQKLKFYWNKEMIVVIFCTESIRIRHWLTKGIKMCHSKWTSVPNARHFKNVIFLNGYWYCSFLKRQLNVVKAKWLWNRITQSEVLPGSTFVLRLWTGWYVKHFVNVFFKVKQEALLYVQPPSASHPGPPVWPEHRPAAEPGLCGLSPPWRDPAGQDTLDVGAGHSTVSITVLL